MLSFCLSLIEDPDLESAFENIYFAHRKRMMAIALSILENHEDAEDAVQDAFSAIARHARKLASMEERAVEVYVCKCAKTAALNMLPDKRRRAMIQPLEEHLDIHDEDIPTEYLVLENYEAVLRAIRSLPEIYRDTLSLYYISDMKPREIAVSLGRPVETVKSQIKRGKTMLAEKIREEMLL